MIDEEKVNNLEIVFLSIIIVLLLAIIAVVLLKGKNSDLNGEKFYFNLSGDEYISFTKDEYTYVRNIGEDFKVLKTETGQYTFKNDLITLDNDLTFDYNKKYLVLNTQEKYVFFNNKYIIETFNSYSKEIDSSVKSLRGNDSNLGKVANTISDIIYCTSDKDINCYISYNIYFDEAENYTETECLKSEKYSTYGVCQNHFVDNAGLFSFNKENELTEAQLE